MVNRQRMGVGDGSTTVGSQMFFFPHPPPQGNSVPQDSEINCHIFIFNKEMDTGLSLAPALTHVREDEGGKRENNTQDYELEA